MENDYLYLSLPIPTAAPAAIDWDKGLIDWDKDASAADVAKTREEQLPLYTDGTLSARSHP